MKKFLLFLLWIAFTGTSSLYGQAWDQVANSWVRLDGGLALPAGYLTIKDETTALAQENVLTFLGAGVTCVDNAGNTATECTIPGGGSVPTGTGFVHITGGAQDAASKTVDVSSSDITGRIPYANQPQVAAHSYVGNNGTATADAAAVSRTNAYADFLLDPTVKVFANEEYCGVSSYSGNAIGAGTQGNSASSDASHPCTRLLSTTTAAATGYNQTWENTTGAGSNITSWGQGQIDFQFIGQLNSIGDGTDQIKVILGFCNQIADATECTNGIYIMYDRSVNTTNWVLCAAKNGSGTTRTDTGIAVTVGSMVRYEMTLNAAGTSLTCMIGGVACSTAVTTNIPTAGAAVQIKLDKTAGATTTFTLNTNKTFAMQRGLGR